ncbi:MAG: hypothetical protein ABI634_20345 [Acidobacteriota bacterium]
MENERRGQVVAGLTFVIVGALLASQQILPWRALEFGQIWPIIVIAFGVHKAWTGISRRDGTAGWGISLMLNGTILLMHTEGVLPMSRSWPLFIVAHGVGMLLGGTNIWRGAWQSDVDSREVRRDH